MRDAAWLIYFDDKDIPPEVFTGPGADAAASARLISLEQSWSVTLFYAPEGPKPSAEQAPAGQPQKMVSVVAAVIEQDGLVRIFRRGGNDSYTGKWEFPGGKVESGESLPDALRRELREEFAVDAEIGPELDHYLYQYPNRSTIDLTFFSVKMLGAPDFLEHTESAWVKPEQLSEYDLINGDMKFVATRYVVARQNDELRSQLAEHRDMANDNHELREQVNDLKGELSTTWEIAKALAAALLEMHGADELVEDCNTCRLLVKARAAKIIE